MLEILDSRIKLIKKAKKQCQDQNSISLKKCRKKYYFEIAYYIHSIKENYELNQLFDELLNYRKNLRNFDEYRNAEISIEKSLKEISIELLQKNDFEIINEKLGNTWSNPFDSWGTLNVKEILEKLSNLNENRLLQNYSDLRNLIFNDDGLNGIVNRWHRVNNENFESVFEHINSITDKIQILNYYEDFKYGFTGGKAAKKLNEFYLSIHPIYVEDIFLNIYRSAIHNGEDIGDISELLDYCEVLRDYFNKKLSNKFSIENSILKFKHYMEVFNEKYGKENPEKDFQKDFELFLFNNGYFALSEGQVGNGRFDDIVINQNNAFLCELKQEGFRKNKNFTTTNTIRKKIESAKIQTKTYHERLREFPNLSTDVFVIIFCKNYSRFKNDENRIQFDSLTFNFFIVNLNKNSPSTQKIVNFIDIESHLEK